jgi:hypothetical protein
MKCFSAILFILIFGLEGVTATAKPVYFEFEVQIENLLTQKTLQTTGYFQSTRNFAKRFISSRFVFKFPGVSPHVDLNEKYIESKDGKWTETYNDRLGKIRTVPAEVKHDGNTLKEIIVTDRANADGFENGHNYYDSDRIDGATEIFDRNHKPSYRLRIHGRPIEKSAYDRGLKTIALAKLIPL